MSLSKDYNNFSGYQYPLVNDNANGISFFLLFVPDEKAHFSVYSIFKRLTWP